MKQTTTLEVSEREARVILEAFECLQRYMQKLAETTDDEDKQADISNDLAYAMDLQERLEQKWTRDLGPNVLNQLYPEDE
jgi:hypothetical protein